MYTTTSFEQINIETQLKDFLDGEDKFEREKHIAFLTNLLNHGCEATVVYSSKPCFVFWTLHSLNMLGALDKPCSDSMISLQERCTEYLVGLLRSGSTLGVVGGGCGQIEDVADTYAAIAALASLGDERCLAAVDRNAVYRFLLDRKKQDGSFEMHKDGETDVRAVYSAISVASLLGIFTPDLTQGVVEWVVRCQTYEGGFASSPGREAHGGNSFCAFATLLLLGNPFAADVARLHKWVAKRQMEFSGGFQGRTNKVVDGCYSFWVGSVASMVRSAYQSIGIPSDRNCFDAERLLHFVLTCSQDQARGGFRDKPGYKPDQNHTCYCISGLAECLRDVSSDLLNLKRLDCVYCIEEGRVAWLKSHWTDEDK